VGGEVPYDVERRIKPIYLLLVLCFLLLAWCLLLLARSTHRLDALDTRVAACEGTEP